MPEGEPARGETSSLALALALTPGTLLAGMAGGIAFPILPIVGLRFGLPLAFIGVILAANRAVRVLAAPFIGALTDRLGGRRLLLAGLVIQAVVMGLYALGVLLAAPGPFFLGGRILHGFGSAAVFVSAQALALHAGGARDAGRTAGAVRAAIVLGVPVGLFTGGLLSDAFGDTTTFLIAAGAEVVALAGAYFSVPDLRAAVATRPPLLETVRAMRDRRLLAVGALNLALSFAAGGMVLTTLALLIHERGISVFSRNEQGTAGLLMGWMTVVDAATTPLAGRAGDRFRAHARVAASALLALIAGLLVIGASRHAVGLATGLALVGLGGAGLGPSLLVMMGAIVPRERRGTGVGLLQLCGDVGGMLGPLVGTAIFAGGTAYYLSAAVLACVLPLALWLVRLESRARAAELAKSAAPPR